MSILHFFGLIAMLSLLSACGSSNGGGSDPVTGTAETVSKTITGSTAAAGVLCNADVEVATLDGTVLFRGKSNQYSSLTDSTDYNATAARLLPFAQRQAGRFSVRHTFLVQNVPAEASMLLVTVRGGHDIDPDGDGFVVQGADRNFEGPLYAYAAFGDLVEGNVSVNLLSSAAAVAAAERHLYVPSTIRRILDGAAAVMFSGDPRGGPVSYATLTRFNPAVVENNTSADFSFLADADGYRTLSGGLYASALYEGNRTGQLQDSDGEGLLDAFEGLIGTDAGKADTDGDGVNDYAEVWAGTDPLDISSTAGDLLYAYQWHLHNSGQPSGAVYGGVPGEDLRIPDNIPTYRGSGRVVVGVVDSGIESGHPDLKNMLDISLSYNYRTHTKDPIPMESDIGYHGTACAGIIGAQGYNGGGVRGVAPMTRLAGFNVFSSGRVSDFTDAFGRSDIDIFSNSWGPVSSASLTDWGFEFESALQDGAVNGRDGKGAIYVFAAGNDRRDAHEGYANTSSLHNSKYAITVSSVNADGTLSSYSNTGANVLVAGTGGEYGFDSPAVVTTDLTGVEIGRDTYYGHDGSIIGDSSLDGNNPDGNYTRFMNGTSAACPSIAGVCALILQANPELTRRDVRYILARTARRNDVADGNWSSNGAGLHINAKYGFGIADAAAAVTMAQGFPGLGDERVTSQYTDTARVDIPDGDANGTERSIEIPEAITAEHVDVWVTVDHSHIDDLRIVLISPAGTESVLAVGGENYIYPLESYTDWRFSTVRCLDENSQGSWRLKVMDVVPGRSGSLENWRIQVSGH
ncbi:S8 family serine peptidase [Sulfurimonas sp. HSL1-2]|uniref:S8 family serine peptidase n=1 Tax=Thiomicrolovo zhangzhouensis TaxID=3131933 RepID=UPI0031F80156